MTKQKEGAAGAGKGTRPSAGIPRGARGRRKALKWAGRLLARIVILWLVITSVEVVLLRFLNPPCTVHVAWEWLGHLIRQTPYQAPRRSWRPLSRISPNLKRAVLAAEDQRFLYHHGFDLVELRVALKDLFEARRQRGASTISMQTARTVFLPRSRTCTRKALEAYFTVLIELFWSKGRILEIYLNTVDWGPGLMGAEAASRAYFSIPASALSPRQAALMAAILPSPHRWSVSHPDAVVRYRQRWILQEMRKMPYL